MLHSGPASGQTFIVYMLPNMVRFVLKLVQNALCLAISEKVYDNSSKPTTLISPLKNPLTVLFKVRCVEEEELNIYISCKSHFRKRRNRNPDQ